MSNSLPFNAPSPRGDLDHPDAKLSQWLGVRLQQDRLRFEQQIVELTTLLQQQHTSLIADVKGKLEAARLSGNVVLPPSMPSEGMMKGEPSTEPPYLPTGGAATTPKTQYAWEGPGMTPNLKTKSNSTAAGQDSQVSALVAKPMLPHGRSKFKSTHSVKHAPSSLHRIVSSAGFEIATGLLIFANTVVLAAEIQYHGLDNGYDLGVPKYGRPADKSWPSADPVFRTFEYFFAGIFMLELVLRVGVAPWQSLKSVFIWMDGLLVCFSIFDIVHSLTTQGSNNFFLNATMMRLVRLIRIVRVLKMVRAVRAFDSLYLLLRSIQASFGALVWSFVFLFFVQLATGMFLCQLLRSYIEDDIQGDPEKLGQRRQVFLYFGTFTRTMVTMFEVTLANWAPSCRLLMDNVSEWYGLFYILYRCMFCFAVLKVIAAVFINETNRVASTDDEIAMMKDRKSTAVYTIKLKEVFSQLDCTGDGQLEWSELEEALQDVQMQAWLKSLDVDIHHLADLFTLIDNGEGTISLSEFVEGVTRSKGNAKSIDILLLKKMLNHLEDKIEGLQTAVAQVTTGQQRLAMVSVGETSPMNLKHSTSSISAARHAGTPSSCAV